MTRHDQHLRLKSLVPSVPVPEDFEEQLWLRRMLRELPSAPVPDGFEEMLWNRIRTEQRRTVWKRSLLLLSLVLTLGGAIGIWQLLTPPTPNSPPLRQPLVIAPLTVSPDTRFTAKATPPERPALQRHRELSPIPGGTTPMLPPEE